jgi:hypothetical protein
MLLSDIAVLLVWGTCLRNVVSQGRYLDLIQGMTPIKRGFLDCLAGNWLLATNPARDHVIRW